MKVKTLIIRWLVSMGLVIAILGSYQAQSADKVEGCAPLTVSFDGGNQSKYYWEFGDGAISEDKSPTNTYATTGTFEAKLYDGLGGELLFSTTITVFELPIIEISSDVKSGCGPLTVHFNNETNVDDRIEIEGYFWDFGDGQTSIEENPIHTFENARKYNVVLRISAKNGCTAVGNFPEYIEVTEIVETDFFVDQSYICDAPATFNITNETNENLGYSYSWDFGNGNTFQGYNPGSITYTEDGRYTITMTVDNGDGCIVDILKSVRVGPPSFDLNVPAIVCKDFLNVFSNSGEGKETRWTFEEGAFAETLDKDTTLVRFINAGETTVTVSTYDDLSCINDTTLTIMVEVPDASFEIIPEYTCSQPAVFTFVANNPNHNQYIWEVINIINNSTKTIQGTANQTYTINYPQRDSMQIDHPGSYVVKLTVISANGCISDSFQSFETYPIEARTVPSFHDGCVPLTVNFEDVSKTLEEIVYWEYLIDEASAYTSTSEGDFTHTFTETGEYKVRIIAENKSGCRDTSAGVWIQVGEQISIDANIDKTDICLFDSIQVDFDNIDPRLDAYKITGDDYRISHCYNSPSVTHQFIHEPGSFPIEVTTEYNGCYLTQDLGTINVSGPKSRIKFMTNCSDPYTVMLQDSSLNHGSAVWIIGKDTLTEVAVGATMNYTFDSIGKKEIILIAFPNVGESCSPDTSYASINITDVKADFELPELICANNTYTLNASNSLDVHNECNAGYTWYGVGPRPRKVDKDSLTEIAWPPGEVRVFLVAEDINGCRDTLQRVSESYNIIANFTVDRNPICLPAELQFTDESITDNPITEWDWSFGSNEQNPTHTINSVGEDFKIQLLITDDKGCQDSVVQTLSNYVPESSISILPGSTVCVGQEFELFATDYTEQGSSLNFTWDIPTFGTVTGQNVVAKIDQTGSFQYSLTIEEKSSGCMRTYTRIIDVVPFPEASFTPDLTDALCPGDDVTFLGDGNINADLNYSWDFGDGGVGFGQNANHIFFDGTYDVTLTVTTAEGGCSDSVTKTATIEGPKGGFTADKSIICQNEPITFTLTDTSAVASYTWDLGDGSFVTDVSPLTHSFDYDSIPVGNLQPVDVILMSENGCEKVFTQFIQLYDVNARFKIIDDPESCPGELVVENLSSGADKILWNFGDGTTSTELNPTHTYGDSSVYVITLTVENDTETCSDSDEQEFVVEGLERVQMPNIFSPNGDDVNDYFNIAINEKYQDQLNCIEVIKAKIFNRWGNLIYDNELPKEGWDGRYDDGTAAPAEVYTYIFTVVYGNQSEDTFKGTVTLVK